MSDEIVDENGNFITLAFALHDAAREKGYTPTGWRVSPRMAVQIADYYGIHITIPEDLTSWMGLPVEVDPTAIGIALLRERPGIRVAPERILTDLIAQLRDPDNYTTRTVLADNAEQRLRDVTSGEPCPCGDWHTRLPCCGVPDTDCERANGDFSDYLGHVDHCIRGRRG